MLFRKHLIPWKGKMKRKIFLLVIFLSCMLTAHLTWARPPSSIDLTYDPKTEILHIDLKHPSSNPQQHHIRKILVYKNNEEPILFHYASQTSAEGTIQDVPLKAKPQDVIRGEAICSDAGCGDQTLIIPADVK